MNPNCIVVAGASGFVGKALIDRLLIEFPLVSIVALSRSSKQGADPRVHWRKCDLFSEESITRTLPAKVDLVYYLVHSMEPTAQLDQGSFADYDLIMADNFARVCRTKGVEQLVYLGGLIPDRRDLSRHLASRLEVETVFKDHNIPHTFFRAGLILGENGSSFQILLKLIRRLRVMICPTWTQTLTSPVDLPAVIQAMVTVAKSSEHLNRTYDLSGCRPLAYVDMMRLTAQHLGLRRFFVKVPLFSPTLSRLWVSLITNTSRYLVYPLIESLEHPMVARDTHCFYPESNSKDYLELLKGISTRTISKPSTVRIRRRTVRSVQRIPVSNQSALSLAEAYFNWLPRLMRGLVTVVNDENRIRLRLLNYITLIEFEKSRTRADSDQVSYAIRKGALVRPSPSARLEFRLVLNRKFVVVAIHDYVPALPWFVYRYTQALAHSGVMSAFRTFLIANSRTKSHDQIKIAEIRTGKES